MRSVRPITVATIKRLGSSGSDAELALLTAVLGLVIVAIANWYALDSTRGMR